MNLGLPTRRQNLATQTSLAGVPELLSPRNFVVVALCLGAVVFAVYSPALEFQFVLDDHRFTGRSAYPVRRSCVGLLCELCVGAIHRRASEFLSASVHPVAEDQFHSERSVSMGMAPAQHHETCGSCGLAGSSGAEATARSRRRVIGRDIVRLASGTDRIRGVGYGARPLDGSGSTGCGAAISQVGAGLPGSQTHERKSRTWARTKKATQPGAFWLIASAAACFAALLAKETAIVLPALIFALALLMSARRGRRHRFWSAAGAGVSANSAVFVRDGVLPSDAAPCLWGKARVTDPAFALECSYFCRGLRPSGST